LTRLWSALAGIALLVAMAAYVGIPSAAATRRPGALPVTQDGITIESVAGGGTGTSGPLTVVLSAPSGESISSVAAQLSYGTTTVNSGPLAFQTNNADGSETWSTQGALEAPPGSYTVSLTATDSGGDTLTNYTVPGVTIAYLMQPTISNFSASSSTVDFDHQTVTFSGTVTGMLDGVTYQPTDQPLAISEVGTGAPSPSLIETDNNDGNFSYPMSFVPLSVQNGTEVQVEVLATATVAGGTTSILGPIMVDQDSIQVTANTSAPSVPTGGQLTVSGTVSYQPQAGGDETAEGVAVEVEAPGQTGDPLATGTTGSNGSYSLTFSPGASGTYNVYAGDLPEGIQAYPDALYFSGAGTSFTVAIRNPVSLGSWQPAIDYSNDQITGSVCVSPAIAATAAASEIQYAPNVGGPWSSFGTLSPTQGTSPDCAVGGTPGILMGGTFAVPVAAGFYQVSFPGSPSLLPSVSSAVYVANSVTVTDWRPTINAEGYLSGSACVAPVAAIGQSLEVVWSTNSKSTSWYPLGKVGRALGGRPCSANGLPGATVTVSSLKALEPGAYYELWFLGTSTLLFAESPYVYVSRDLTRITNLIVHPTRLRRGGKLTISGRLWQNDRGWKAYGSRRVEVVFLTPHQRLVNIQVVVKTNRSGWFTTTFADNHGTTHWAVQYMANGDPTHYDCTSNEVLVTVVRLKAIQS
jgi:hypothetical protein